MRCGKCQGKMAVLDSRHLRNAVKRKRKCQNCEAIISTFESEYDVGAMLAGVARDLGRHIKAAKNIEAEMYTFVERVTNAVSIVTAEGRREGKASRGSTARPEILRTKRIWSAEELEKLDELYPQFGARVTATRLGRTMSAIRTKVHERGLKLRKSAALIRMALESNAE